MTENENPASEGEAEGIEQQPEQENQVEQQEEERKIPLAALESERRKRQEAEAQIRVYEQYLNQPKEKPEEDDADDWITKKEYRQNVQKNINEAKREILEEAFVQSNPDAYKKINDYLPELVKQKPWVKEVIENSGNRWQRAWELLNDLYLPQQEKKHQQSENAKRIVENSQKPGSPTTVGKSRTASTVDYIRSIRGTSEWDEYRAKLRRGETAL